MINKVILTGRIANDLELKYTSSNIPFVRITLAVNRTYQNQNGEREADFIYCTAWRNQAENLCKFMRKGSLIGLEGRLQVNQFQQDGQNRYSTDVVADQITFLESRNSQGNNNRSDSVPAYNNNSANRTSQQQQYGTQMPEQNGYGSQMNNQNNSYPNNSYAGNNVNNTNANANSNMNKSYNNQNNGGSNFAPDLFDDDDLPF